MNYFLCFFLLIATFGCSPKYPAFIFDAGDDPIHEGLYRIENERGQIGYADEKRNVVIEPQFAFGFPFEGGKAEVTNTGKCIVIDGGEHSYWKSDEWYYIDKKGNKIE